jgi:hypothetical protein
MISISTISSYNNLQYYNFSNYPLSRDIWAMIFSHLDSPQDMWALSLTNRNLFQIFSDSNFSLFWDRLVERHFPGRGREKTTKSSKDVYQQLKIVRNNMAAGQYQFQTFSGHESEFCCFFIYNGKRISVSWNRAWDIESGKELQLVSQSGRFHTILGSVPKRLAIVKYTLL